MSLSFGRDVAPHGSDVEFGKSARFFFLFSILFRGSYTIQVLQKGRGAIKSFREFSEELPRSLELLAEASQTFELLLIACSYSQFGVIIGNDFGLRTRLLQHQWRWSR